MRKFTLLKQEGSARRGRFETVHGTIETPVFMNVGTAGAIKGANLEQSNVDLTASLVDLIIAQRTYQANCQALQTQNTMMDAIMSVR